MIKMPLTEYLKANSQQALACTVGLCESDKHKSVRSGKHLSVTVHSDGAIELREEKTIGLLHKLESIPAVPDQVA